MFINSSACHLWDLNLGWEYNNHYSQPLKLDLIDKYKYRQKLL